MAFSLGRQERMLKSSDFRRALKQGRRLRSPHLTVVVFQRQYGKVRLGLTVSKKIGNAVVRNRLKRRLREIVRVRRSSLVRPWDVLVLAQEGSGALNLAALALELEPVFRELDRLEQASDAIRSRSETAPLRNRQIKA